MAEAVSWDLDVLPRLATVLRAIPEDAESSREQLRKQFQEIWDRPPVDELEAVLRVKFTPDRARALSFAPARNREHTQFYPLLISSPPDGAPKEHPQRRVQVVALSLLYMLHVHEASFVGDFCLAGGLAALANLVSHENLMIRAQAMEVMLTLTGAEALGWFDDPPSKAQRELHQSMLALTRTNIITALMANYESTFPGGGMLSLQLLGFYLSWLRYFYCQDRIIRVSSKIIRTLEAWSERADVAQTERDFAKILYDDFKRFPAAEPAALAVEDRAQDAVTGAEKADEEGLSLCRANALILPEPDPAANIASKPVQQTQESALSLKSQGNAAFAQGAYRHAIELYDVAIETAETSGGETKDDSEDRAKMFANRAAARMELHKRREASPENNCMESCVEDCRRAISLSPTYFKAHFRLMQALMHTERWEEVSAALAVAQGLQTSDPTEQRALDELERKLSLSAAANAERAQEFQDTFAAFMRRFEEPSQRNEAHQVELDSDRVETDETKETEEISSKVTAATALASEKGRFKQKASKRRGSSLVSILKTQPTEAAREAVLAHLAEGSLQAAFADQLDEASFEAMVKVVDSLLPARAEEARNVLAALADVKRFSLNLMFLSSATKKQLDADFAILRSVMGPRAQDLRALEAKYAA